MHILFIGYGKTSRYIAKQLFPQGHQITTVSLSKKDDDGAEHLQQDIHSLDLTGVDPVDVAYVLLSPKESSLEAYQHIFLKPISKIAQTLKSHPIKKVIVVSSTRVYGQNQAEIINDDTEVQPNDPKGEVLVQMEQAWQAEFPEQCIIVRPTGIYGVSVARMLKLAESTKTYPNIHWSNRIHIEDLARFLSHLIHVEQFEKTYICTNHQPMPLHEIIRWFQKQMNYPQLSLESEHQVGKKIYADRMQRMGFKLEHEQFFKDYQDLI